MCSNDEDIVIQFEPSARDGEKVGIKVGDTVKINDILYVFTKKVDTTERKQWYPGEFMYTGTVVITLTPREKM